MKRVLFILFLIVTAAALYFFVFKKDEGPQAPRQQPIAVKSHSTGFDKNVDSVLDAYGAVRDAFVEGDSLTAKQKAADMVALLKRLSLDELKKEYDFVVLDTPPIGLVTDGIMAMKRADLSIYVFRANYSKKDFIRSFQRMVTINKFKNIAIILNSLPTSSKTYGYGYYEDKTPQKGIIRKLART